MNGNYNIRLISLQNLRALMQRDLPPVMQRWHLPMSDFDSLYSYLISEMVKRMVVPTLSCEHTDVWKDIHRCVYDEVWWIYWPYVHQALLNGYPSILNNKRHVKLLVLGDTMLLGELLNES